MIKKNLDNTAADGQQLDHLIQSTVDYHNASAEILVIYTRAVERFRAMQELRKRANSKRIFLSTYVALFWVSSNSFSLYPVVVVGKISNDISE